MKKKKHRDSIFYFTSILARAQLVSYMVIWLGLFNCTSRKQCKTIFYDLLALVTEREMLNEPFCEMKKDTQTK